MLRQFTWVVIERFGRMESALQQRAESAAKRFRTATGAEQLEEEILFLPAASVAPLFETATWIGRAAAQQLVELFTTKGSFGSREIVESDLALVQALPVVVVRNRSGDLLRLKRREQRKGSPLHGKVVIWAGGHVRREDGANGPSIGHGAVRELQEELRLSVEPRELEMLGGLDPGPRWGSDQAPRRHRVRVARANG